MPTAQAVAIREETAIERIHQAAVTLKARTGAEFSDIDLSGRMAAVERQAVTLEQIADLLESLVVVLQEPVVIDADDEAPDDDEKEESENGTDTGKRRPNPRRKA